MSVTGCQAMIELRQAFESGKDDDTCTLTRQQLEAWLAHLSWHAPEMLGIDAVLNGAPSVSNELLDQLAELLWNCRESNRQIDGDQE